MEIKQITVLNLSEYELESLISKVVSSYFSAPMCKTKEDKVWLTRDMAAKHLKVSLPTLDKFIKAGKISSYRIGRRRYVNRDELDHAIIKNKTTINYKTT